MTRVGAETILLVLFVPVSSVFVCETPRKRFLLGFAFSTVLNVVPHS